MIKVMNKDDFGTKVIRGLRRDEQILVKCESFHQSQCVRTLVRQFRLLYPEHLDSNGIETYKTQATGEGDILVTVVSAQAPIFLQ